MNSRSRSDGKMETLMVLQTKGEFKSQKIRRWWEKAVVTVVPESGGRVEIPRLQADGAPVWKFARSVMV